MVDAVKVGLLPERKQNEIVSVALVVEAVAHPTRDDSDHASLKVVLRSIQMQDRLALHRIIKLGLIVHPGASAAATLEGALINVDRRCTSDIVVGQQFRRVALVEHKGLYLSWVNDLSYSHVCTVSVVKVGKIWGRPLRQKR